MTAQYRKKAALTRESVIAILQNELPYLKNKYGVEKIILYGSFAKGQPKKKSDIDILVDLRRNLGFEFIGLADRLEEILGRKVDVATFEHFKRSFDNPRYKHIAEDIKQSMIYV